MLNSSLADSNMLCLVNDSKIELNLQQVEVITHIKQFLKSTSKIFVLSGHAGTGKTTVIKKILDNYEGQAVVSAPTNKALQMISEIAMFDGVTIHSLLGLQPDVSLDDFNPNEPRFSQVKSSTIQNYNLIVIDEASMINDALFNLIQVELNNFFKVKIIFMGDKAQLPPIAQEFSKVFSFNTIYKYELTTLVRQTMCNPLLVSYELLRDNINNENFKLNFKTKMNEKNEGLMVLSSNEEFRVKLIELFTSKNYKENINHAKLIAWRNITIKQSNIIIRNILFNNPKKIILKDDVLTGYRTIKGTRTVPYYINNCMDYRVSTVSRRQKNSYGIYGYTVKISEKNIFSKSIFGKKVFIIDHSNEENLHNYAEQHDTLVDIAKADKKKWVAYYNFRRDNLIMVNIFSYRYGARREKNKQISKDLDYGYAVTCHKAQGSTYDYVFILSKDILLNKNHKEKNQMLYVALTRPKYLAIVLK